VVVKRRAASISILVLAFSIPSVCLAQNEPAGEQEIGNETGEASQEQAEEQTVDSVEPAPAEVETVQPAPAPEPSPAIVEAQSAPRQRVRMPGRGLVIAGWSLFGAGYLISATTGIIMWDSVRYGWFPIIPVVGSAMYGVHLFSMEGDDAERTAYRMLGVLMFIPSIMQAGGLALAIAGHVRRSRWQREHGEFAFFPIGPQNTPGLSLSGVFF
jgi:hypothetical protein